MKFQCACGALIVDQSDGLPHKAWLLPDQEWEPLFDDLEARVVDRLARRMLTRDGAKQAVREIVMRPLRAVWQCRACGRLYLDNPSRELQCFVPEDETTDRHVLRGAVEGC